MSTRKSPYSYAVDVLSNNLTFAQAAVLATLRSASDGAVHTLAVKSRNGGGLVCENGVQATIRAGGVALRSFNFTDSCSSYLADGQRFTRFDSACARALTRAQATRATCTVVCLAHDKQRIASVEIEAFAR
jgi:hypothetical protein